MHASARACTKRKRKKRRRQHQEQILCWEACVILLAPNPQPLRNLSQVPKKPNQARKCPRCNTSVIVPCCGRDRELAHEVLK